MGAPALFFCRVPPTAAGRGDLPPTGGPGLEPIRPACSPTGERTPAPPDVGWGRAAAQVARPHGGGDLCPRPLAGGGRPPFRPLGPPPPVDRARAGCTPPSPATGRFTPPFRQPQGVKFERPPHTESGDDLLHSAPAQKAAAAGEPQFCRQTPHPRRLFNRWKGRPRQGQPDARPQGGSPPAVPALQPSARPSPSPANAFQSTGAVRPARPHRGAGNGLPPFTGRWLRSGLPPPPAGNCRSICPSARRQNRWSCWRCITCWSGQRAAERRRFARPPPGRRFALDPPGPAKPRGR